MNFSDTPLNDHPSRIIDWISCSFNDAPSPCDSCENHVRCKTEDLACKNFISYVENGTYECNEHKINGHPERKHFVKAFLNKSHQTLNEQEIHAIKEMNKIRGTNYRAIADSFYVLPETVRKILGVI